MSKLQKHTDEEKIYTIRAWYKEDEYQIIRDDLTRNKLPAVVGLRSVQSIPYNRREEPYGKYISRLVVTCKTGEAMHAVINLLRSTSELVEVLDDNDEFCPCHRIGEAA